jgi:hypothetical protein
MSGTGITAGILVSPDPITYGNVNLGSYKDVVVTISNSGDAQLIISNMVITGADASMFQILRGITSLTIAGKGSDTLAIRFKPSSTGAKTAIFTITHNATGSPTSVNMIGNGQQVVVSCGILRTYAAKPGEFITIPVKAFDPIPINIANNFNFVLLYKKTILYPKLVSAGERTNGFTVTTDSSKAGELHVQVKSPSSSTYISGSGDLVKIDFLALLGDSSGSPLKFQSQSFVFEGNGPQVITQDGSFTLTGRGQDQKGWVTNRGGSLLKQNSPNPVVMGIGTDIQYGVENVGNVKIAVYDVLGREIAKLVDENKDIGWYNVHFDAKGLTTGVYFYRLVVSWSNPLQSGKVDEMKKMLIIR